MKLPRVRFTVRRMMVAVAIVGLVVGNYARLASQTRGSRSYGFPVAAWRVMLLSLAWDAVFLAILGCLWLAVKAARRSVAPDPPEPE
jgi:hypothetical protein